MNKTKKKRKRVGAVQQKILLLLLGGLTLGLQRSPKGYFKVLKSMRGAWKEIDESALSYAIRALYESKLLEQKANRDGSITFILNREGEKLALKYDMEKMAIHRHKWDSVWRIIIFDIPEKKKRIRDSLRFHLKKLGFVELQKSVFILPFECRNEIEYITEFYNARKFIRYIEANHIDNELDLKNRFQLT